MHLPTKITLIVMIIVILFGFLIGVMNAQTHTNDAPLQTETPVSFWTLNPMEVVCNHSQSMVGTIMCINAFISHVVNHPDVIATPFPTPFPEPRLQELTDTGDDLVFCTGDCIAPIEIYFTGINTFNCPNDRAISVYFHDVTSGYEGYVTGLTSKDWRVTVGKTQIYMTTHLIQELGETAQDAGDYTLTMYCKPPSK